MKKSENLGRQERKVAAAETLAQIGSLTATASPKIAAMLAYIRENLFDPALSVAGMKAACNLRDNSIALQFHHELGKPPSAFITDCRLAVADRLLADSLLPVWRITELLGYSSIQVFSRAYLRRKGRRPRDFRRQSPGNNPLLAEARGESSQDLLTRALAGQLDEQAAATLIRRLLEVYPPQHPRRSPESVLALTGLPG